jgi:hypothetical protein
MSIQQPSGVPYVSLCTPTFNRRPFIAAMIECFNHQTYPKDRMEWIIIDDGTDKIGDLVTHIPNVKYFEYADKMTLGKKRNILHEKSRGEIIVYMDDDDYYPPERVSHAVEMLQLHPTVLCAGSSEIYIYFKHIEKLYQFGPYGPTHATAGTFAFKRELLSHTRYDESACLAEERHFLKDYTIPMVQLDPRKVILVFSHDHNTFDKRKLLEVSNTAVKETSKTVDDFIIGDSATKLKRFYMDEMGGVLKFYDPGHPRMKPDVIEQTAQLEKTRRNMTQSAGPATNDGAAIIMQQEGKEPIVLTNDQVVNIIHLQQTQVKDLTANLASVQKEKTKLENTITFLTSQHQQQPHADPASSKVNLTLLESCMSELSDRDETIKKLKGLYMKSIVESGELKTQLGEMRQLIQDLQTKLFHFRTNQNEIKNQTQ